MSETNRNHHRICAGIVLYNPEIDLLKKDIDAICHQVDAIFLYDNASENSDDIQNMMRDYRDIYYKRGESNGGIARGLNEILQFALDNHYDWYLTMDQDSLCADNMMHEYARYMERPKTGLICPVILSNGKLTLEEMNERRTSDYEIVKKPITCISSACLNKTELVNQLGGYPEDYFIDNVDTDLNCRVMLAGYDIIRVNTTYMAQHLGNARPIPLFAFLYKVTGFDCFRRMQVSSVYSDMRLYYSARNSHVVYKKYPNAGFRVSPVFMFLLFCYYTVTYPFSRNRISMWKHIIKGYKDSKEMLK